MVSKKRAGDDGSGGNQERTLPLLILAVVAAGILLQPWPAGQVGLAAMVCGCFVPIGKSSLPLIGIVGICLLILSPLAAVAGFVIGWYFRQLMCGREDKL